MTVLISLWLTALLFGGMVLFAFGFAAFLFSALPMPMARTALRRAFPHFYLFVMVTAAVAAVCRWAASDLVSAGLLAAIALSTVPTRQWLMPAINAATDAGAASRFKVLHTLSVLVSLGHIGLAALALSRFA